MLGAFGIFVFSLVCFSFVVGHGVDVGLLGELHWCNTLCLCHNETQERMHCYSENEIYALMNVEERKVLKLQHANFRLDEKLTWCSEVCLCHKIGKKNFKCTDHQTLGGFIRDVTPKLAHYLVADEPEVDDLRDFIEREEELEHSTGSPDERKKSKKHRKNKKKKHHERKEEPSSTTTTEAAMEEEEDYALPSTTAKSPEAPKHNHSSAPSQQNVIVLQASTGRELTSHTSPNYAHPSSPVVEIPLERKTVAGEVSKDLAELRENVDHIKEDVAMNQHILLVTVAVASVAIIGVFILAIYSCCIRRATTKHTITKPQRNHCITQEENTQTKANLEEAW